MNKSFKVTVPVHIKRYFLTQDSLLIEMNSIMNVKEILKSKPFLYDLLENPPIKPWEEWETTIPILLEEWKEKREIISLTFQNRKGKANRDQMLYSIGLYVLFIHWLNNLPFKEESFSNFTYQPMNLDDRILFIKQKPQQYHSFIQLQQLFQETEKLFHKRKVLVKQNKAITEK